MGIFAPGDLQEMASMASMTSIGRSSPGELNAWEKFLQEILQDPLICLAVAQISEGDHGYSLCLLWTYRTRNGNLCLFSVDVIYTNGELWIFYIYASLLEGISLHHHLFAGVVLLLFCRFASCWCHWEPSAICWRTGGRGGQVNVASGAQMASLPKNPQ